MKSNCLIKEDIKSLEDLGNTLKNLVRTFDCKKIDIDIENSRYYPGKGYSADISYKLGAYKIVKNLTFDENISDDKLMENALKILSYYIKPCGIGSKLNRHEKGSFYIFKENFGKK